MRRKQGLDDGADPAAHESSPTRISDENLPHSLDAGTASLPWVGPNPYCRSHQTWGASACVFVHIEMTETARSVSKGESFRSTGAPDRRSRETKGLNRFRGLFFLIA